MNDLRIGGGAVNPLASTVSSQAGAKAPSGGKSFAETIKDSIAKVEDMQQSADQSITDLAVGRTSNLHETMINVEQADISFRMLMAVRTKVISAYHEIMRMSF